MHHALNRPFYLLSRWVRRVFYHLSVCVGLVLSLSFYLGQGPFLDTAATREPDGSSTDRHQTHVFGTAAPVGHWGMVLVLRGGLGAL